MIGTDTTTSSTVPRVDGGARLSVDELRALAAALRAEAEIAEERDRQ